MREDCGPYNKTVKIELPDDLEEIEKCIDFINENKRNEIWIEVDYESPKIGLDFMKRIEEPQMIRDLRLSGNFGMSDVIYDFSELRNLSYFPKEKEYIDLLRFDKLEELDTTKPLTLQNMEKSNITQYGQCNDGDVKLEVLSKFPDLKRIWLHGPSNFKFADFACRSKLENITVVECNIKDLQGIEKFTELRVVDLTYCRSINSIEGLSELPKLRTVLLDSCPRLKDISELGKIPTLRALYLESMKNRDLGFLEDMSCKQVLECLMIKGGGSIPSVGFLNDYPNLQAFDCIYTNVVDGDLTPLLRLESARASNSRHYNVKKKDLPFGRAFYKWYNIK